MANNYEQFSEMIECHTGLQREGLLEMLDARSDNDVYICEYAPENDTKVLVYADEGCDVEELAEIITAWLRKFDLDDYIIISIAYTCSKPRPGEFGGYAMGITKDRVEGLDARDAMKRLLAKE